MPRSAKKQELELNQVIDSDNSLYIVRENKEGKYLTLLMNVTPEVLGVEKGENVGDARMVLCINSEYISLRLSQLTNIPTVNKIFAGSPFKGASKDLPYLQEWFFNKLLKAKELVYVNYAGKIEGSELWICREGIYQQGKFIFPLKSEGTIYSQDDKIYYIKIGRESVNPIYIPTLNKCDPANSISDVIELWFKQYEDKVLLGALLGFFIASVHLEKIQKLRGVKSFPQFFIFGTTEGGKTALCRSAMHFWGVDYSAISITGGTPFPIFRSTSTLNQMPIWYDEYRRNIGAAKEDFLRTNFDRTEFERGRPDQTVTTYKNRATLLLSGEDDIKDNANRRRAVSFMLQKKHKVQKKTFEYVSDQGEKLFPELLLFTLKSKFNNEIFNELYSLDLNTPNSTNEEKLCYAAFGAVFGREEGLKLLYAANEYWGKYMDEVKTSSLGIDFLSIADSWFKRTGKYKIEYTTFGALEWVDIDTKTNELLFAGASLARILQSDPLYYQNYELGVKAINRQLIEDYVSSYNSRKYMMGTQQRVVCIPYEENKEEENFNELYERIKHLKSQLVESEDQKNVNVLPIPF